MIAPSEQIRSCHKFVPDPADWWKDESIHYNESQREKAVQESVGKTGNALEYEFNERADRWERESGAQSSPTKKFLHKDFLWVISRGREVIPFIISRLPKARANWLWALETITQENPAKNTADYQSAVKAWQQWHSESRSKK